MNTKKIKVSIKCESSGRALKFPTIFYLDGNKALVSYEFQDKSIVDLEIPEDTKEIYVSNRGYISTVIVLSEEVQDGYIVNLKKYKRKKDDE